MTNFAEIKVGLTAPASKDKLIEIMSRGINMPAAAKALAYIAVQRMSQNEVDAIAGLALHAIGYVERKDIDGLKKFLGDCQVPNQISDIIITGAQTLSKEDKEEDAKEPDAKNKTGK